jgi:predicted TIM-barrel fold metal-dependent hydrolase
MEDIKAIDVMNYPFTPELQDKFWAGYELQIMMKQMFKGRSPMVRCTPDEFIAQMDEAGYGKVLISMPKIYSWNEKKLAIDYTLEEINQLVKTHPSRLVGLASYNPFKITESLKEIEMAVKEYGFKGIYAHTLGHNIPPNHKSMYPCYAKCVELGIPFSLQVGHSLELLPSDPGRPIYLDEVALDFPNLTIIASHTGWPWCEELIALAWKHLNIYIDISAHLPRYLDKSLINYMTTRGQEKTLFGTNGLGLKLCKDQFMEIPMKDDVRKKILRDNAIRVFKL